MFIAIDEVVLSPADIDAALSFFTDVLHFELVGDVCGARHTLAPSFVDAPDQVRAVSLRRPPASGGGVRLVGWTGHAPDPPTARVRRAGFFGITLYVRGIEARLADATAAGWSHSGVHAYELHGTGATVHEAVIAGPGGVNVALVEHLPGRHRCVLAPDDGLLVSEVATAGQVVGHLSAALELYEGALGGHRYLDAPFGGPGPEAMSGLRPGETMHVVMLRGPGSANARFEIIELLDGGEDAPSPFGALVLSVTDHDAVVGRLRTVAGLEDLGALGEGGVACFRTRDGVLLELRPA